MNIKKQHIVLNLIRSGRYSLNPQTGDVVSHVGKEVRILKPIRLYTGYLQYVLDIGYNEQITVYGQGFSYLATYLNTYDPAFVIDHKDQDKANNKPDNLRCITEQENNKDNFKGSHGRKKGFRRVRLPIDVKQAIIELHKQGVSAVKLAAKYGCTRQTIANICNVK